MPKQPAIRKRLSLILLAVLFVISSLMLFEVRSSARIAANEAYDRVLFGSALAISERVFIVGNEIDVDIPYVALEMLASDTQDRVFYQVETDVNSFLTGYADLPPVPGAFENQFDTPIFYDAKYHGDDVRIGAINRYVSSQQLSTRFTVKVAETTDGRQALIQKMITDAILRQFILIIVAGAIMWIGISWGVKPLAHLQGALARRNPEDLHPIEHRVPQEVQHLVDGINDLMKRLSDSMAAMRRFTSNAAHQLRTPLAAIQTQTELALKASSADELKQRLTYLDQSTRQSTRLVNQLLSLAKATPDENSVTFDQIDLVNECKEITKELVPSALSKGIDLGLDCTLNRLEISGHAGLIQEALKNLIENAISYGPENTVVTVRIYKDDNSAKIEVEDTGTGIFPELQEAIFERFNRGNRSDGDGCGLGLPIVKEIVERHGWQISVSSQISKGAKFTISIPL